MGHIHAAAMAEYAKDALETDKPWERWEFCHMRGEYQSLHSHPEWVEDNEYRRKPKATMTHTSAQQPEALRLATGQSGGKSEWADTLHAAVAELRSQRARIAELEDAADMAIKRIAELESQLSAIGAGGVEAPAAPVSTYVEVRECPDCGHVGINDADGSKAACNTCEWYGDSPHEDKCPGCNRVGTMSAACPKCGSRTLLLAETHLLAAAPQAAAHGMEQDAARYQALVESGNFAPSPFDNGMWGLRVSRVPSTKAELDAAVDRVIATQAK